MQSEEVFVYETEFCIVRIHPGPATPEERRQHWEESGRRFFRALERQKRLKEQQQNAELRGTV